MKTPVPAPDQSVFDSRVFSSKKKTPGNRPQCPSPPLKTPPVSRIFTDQPLITPTAKIIHTPGTFVHTPEGLCIQFALVYRIMRVMVGVSIHIFYGVQLYFFTIGFANMCKISYL